MAVGWPGDGADSKRVLSLTWKRHVDPDHAAAVEHGEDQPLDGSKPSTG